MSEKPPSINDHTILMSDCKQGLIRIQTSLQRGYLHLLMLGIVASLLSGCGNHPTAPVRDLSPLQTGLSTYRVKSGDTLYSISFRTGKDYNKIARWNGIQAPYLIYVDDFLRLSPPPGGVAKAPKAKIKTNVASKKQATRQKTLPPLKLPTTVSKWAWPSKGKLIKKYSKLSGSNGINIAARPATAVHSAAAGQIVYAGTGIRGYGQLVIVKHSEQFLSAYAHNQRILVKEGQAVKQGQQIAEMGSTGTNRNMLHFEIRKNGKPVNPLKYLPLKRA